MYACMQNLVQMVSVQKLLPEQLLSLILVMSLFFSVLHNPCIPLKKTLDQVVFAGPQLTDLCISRNGDTKKEQRY